MCSSDLAISEQPLEVPRLLTSFPTCRSVTTCLTATSCHATRCLVVSLDHCRDHAQLKTVVLMATVMEVAQLNSATLLEAHPWGHVVVVLGARAHFWEVE